MKTLRMIARLMKLVARLYRMHKRLKARVILLEDKDRNRRAEKFGEELAKSNKALLDMFDDARPYPRNKPAATNTPPKQHPLADALNEVLVSASLEIHKPLEAQQAVNKPEQHPLSGDTIEAVVDVHVDGCVAWIKGERAIVTKSVYREDCEAHVFSAEGKGENNLWLFGEQFKIADVVQAENKNPNKPVLTMADGVRWMFVGFLTRSGNMPGQYPIGSTHYFDPVVVSMRQIPAGQAEYTDILCFRECAEKAVDASYSRVAPKLIVYEPPVCPGEAMKICAEFKGTDRSFMANRFMNPVHLVEMFCNWALITNAELIAHRDVKEADARFVTIQALVKDGYTLVEAAGSIGSGEYGRCIHDDTDCTVGKIYGPAKLDEEFTPRLIDDAGHAFIPHPINFVRLVRVRPFTDPKKENNQP